MEMKVKFVLLFSNFLINEGFLLESNLQPNKTLNGLIQYLTTDDLIKIERSLEEQHQLIEQQHQTIEHQHMAIELQHRDFLELKAEQTRSMNILTAQVQQKFYELEKHKNNVSFEQPVADNLILQRKVHSLENTTHELKSQLSTAAQTITTFQNQTLALDGKIVGLESEIQTVDTNSRNKINAMETLFGNLNGTVMTIVNKQKVAVTAKVEPKTYKRGERIKFNDIITSIGLSSSTQNNLRSNGTFICESPGLYIMSVVVVSTTGYASFAVFKSNQVMISMWIGHLVSSDMYDTITGVIVVQIEKGDTLYIESQQEAVVTDASVITIVKLE